MAKFQVKTDALDRYTAAIQQLGAQADDIAKRVMYPGAGIIADAIKEGIEGIPTLSPKHMHGTPEDPIDGITSAQKKGLEEGFGLSDFRVEDGSINIKAGFSGYNSTDSETAKARGWTTTKQANAMIARSVESGTSFRKKHPFIHPAVAKNKKKVLQAMQDEFDEELKDLNITLD